MKRDRTIEIQYYDWRLMAWLSSETRDRLDATGRGIYRELIDHCYAQGGFPDDKEWICRKAAATLEQLEKVWPLIEKHFPFDREKTQRENIFARIFRKKTLRYIEGQKRARKIGIAKSREKKDIHKVAPSKPEASPDQGKVTERKVTEGNGTEREIPPPRVREMPPPRTSDLTENTSQRFEEFWAQYPRRIGRDAAASAWCSVVTVANEDAVFACLARYLASDEVARGVVQAAGIAVDKPGWLMSCSRDRWDCDWPKARESPGTLRKTKGQEFEEMVDRI